MFHLKIKLNFDSRLVSLCADYAYVALPINGATSTMIITKSTSIQRRKGY